MIQLKQIRMWANPEQAPSLACQSPFPLTPWVVYLFCLVWQQLQTQHIVLFF